MGWAPPSMRTPRNLGVAPSRFLTTWVRVRVRGRVRVRAGVRVRVGVRVRARVRVTVRVRARVRVRVGGMGKGRGSSRYSPRGPLCAAACSHRSGSSAPG